MNKINCAIIKDLLPVYVSEEASEDTKRLVEEHLENCASCRAEVKMLRKPLIVSPETEQAIISNMKKKRRKKTLRNIACILSVILCICIVSYSMYKDATMDLTSSDLTVSTDSDGNVIMTASKRARNLRLFRIYTQDEEGNTTMYLSLKKVNDVLLFLESPISWFTESASNKYVPLDIYELKQSEDGSYVLEFVSQPNAGSEVVSVLYGDDIVLGKSVTTVYYQPGIEYETTAFYDYMKDLCEAANREEDLVTAEKMIYSKYEVPKSSERELLYSK